MKRQPLTERHEYDAEDRNELYKKTDFKCAHCGVKLVQGRNATLDHYIPLSRGGINQRLNIVPLCQKCNEKKDNKIVGTWYLNHLKKNDLRQLNEYFDSYIQSFDYVTRGNLLACDMYGIKVYCGPPLVTKSSAKRRKIMDAASKTFFLERIRLDAIEDAKEFYVEYLKKYDLLDSEDRAYKEVEFWDMFGVIYCIRDINEKVQFLIPITMSKGVHGEHFLKIWIFSLKSDSVSGTVVKRIPSFFGETIMQEQHLPYMRTSAVIPHEDKSAKYIGGKIVNGFKEQSEILLKSGTRSTDDSKVEFYNKFHDIKHHMDAFFNREGYEIIKPLGTTVLHGYFSEDEIAKWTEKNE